jgi:hypothetical protein
VADSSLEGTETSATDTASDEEVRELDRLMMSLSYAIAHKRAELASLDAAFMEAWRQKEEILRKRIRIVRCATRKRKRKRVLANIPLDELPAYLAALSPSELADALEELEGE